MRVLAIALLVFGIIWIALAMLLIAIGAIGVWLSDGFTAMMELFSPFNVANFVVMLLTLAPGIGLYAAGNALMRKTAKKGQ